MSGKAERRQAREAVAVYHEAKLAELVALVAEATDRFRKGELDPFDVDRVLFQYSRAARALEILQHRGRRVRRTPGTRRTADRLVGARGTYTRWLSRPQRTTQRTSLTATQPNVGLSAACRRVSNCYRIL